ncbi:heavy metal translocating P-type ATPase, partial [Gemmiger formicilis]|nr:heavy metal translocating P-type ATPase [Gemmiger formicilis]
LEVGELLEEWTRKKSVADLARCMSLNVDRVWLRTAQGEVLAPVSQIQPGDAVVVRAGGIIPVDGLVLEGEVTVNQASLTGESI